MLVKPFNTNIDLSFERISHHSSEVVREVKAKISLLIPYRNQALTFYCNELYFFDSESYIVFGHDFGGYFAISVESGKIYYLYDETKDKNNLLLMFCNSNMNSFVIFNNIFMHSVYRQEEKMKKDMVADNEILSDAMDALFLQCDSEAMKEDNFWSIRCYELRDGFFPLNDAQIKFYSEMEKSS